MSVFVLIFMEWVITDQFYFDFFNQCKVKKKYYAKKYLKE